MTIRIRQQAADEIDAIEAALRAARPRVADRFGRAVTAAVGQLEAFPLSGWEIGPSADGSVVFRGWLLTRFPYVLIHLPLPDGVDVLRLVDGRRDLGPILVGLVP